MNKEHRAGIDLVFSAPKSVSIVALHLGDEAVIDAHNQAVIKALDYVEKNLIQYREFDPIAKDVFKVKSDNMVVGTFVHSTSRSNDPQLHTHSVILNITKINKKQFKAISNELIFNNQKLINNIYQNELALNIQNLGYKIDNYDNKFEIAGVIEDIIDDKVYIKTKNDREIIINIDNYSHIDHAYAQTLHKSQGATCKKAILLHSKSDYLSTEALYVAATRATDEFKILTSDKKKLMDTSKRAQAKSSTRDFSGVIDTVIRQQTEKEAQAEANAALKATLDHTLDAVNQK